MPVQYNADALYKKHLYIYTEASPNPNSMKFVLNTMLSVDETLIADYATPEEAALGSPLAAALFDFPFVRRVFMTKNFITVTKDEQTPWEDIIPGMKTFLTDYFEQDKPVWLHSEEDLNPFNIQKGAGITENDSETVRKIKEILEEYIRPAVEGDGGAISFHEYNEAEGIVKVRLQGSCSGCPSSTVTLKAGIENLFKRMLPGKVNTVVAEGV